ncbi:MAG TPA: prepilin-type N-terminal cleavage/methylation domain-containing protein [Actinomycetes bacterium]|nr:prepilin-type N-terminal cleavage/methylation domain-containing protein [Actinomycetes bacterium]
MKQLQQRTPGTATPWISSVPKRLAATYAGRGGRSLPKPIQGRHYRDRGAGFTLIELMVVVLIIAILIAIAIPTFLGARSRAQDRAAQSNLRNALTAEKVYYTDRQAYTVDTTALAGIEPSLTWTANAAVATSGGVHVAKATSTGGATDDTVLLGAKSASGTCFYIKDQATKGTSTTPGTFYAKNATCAAPGSTTVSGTSW